MKFLWQSLALALVIFTVLDLLVERTFNPKNCRVILVERG